MLSELFPIPFQIASVEAIAEMLAEWDIAQTEMLMKKLELAKEQRLEQERKRQEAETSKSVLLTYLLTYLWVFVHCMFFFKLESSLRF